eukprot:IDg17908t1
MSQIAVTNNRPLSEAHAVTYETCGVRLQILLKK